MKAALLLLVLVVAGCGLGGRGHEPPPTFAVEVEGPNEFVFQGEAMDRAALYDRLETLGQVGRNPITNSTRSRINIIADGGAANATARKLMQHCSSVGLANVYFQPQ